MRSKNHKCIICGVEYQACNKCDKAISWRAICDTPGHYQIYLALHEYNVGRIKMADAKRIIERCITGKTEISTFNESVKAKIKQIFALE